MEQFENSKKPEQAVLVSVDTGENDIAASLLELVELAKTAGAEVQASVIQKSEKMNAATCVGSGKLLEIKEFCIANEITLIIFDCELTPTQLRNIEKVTDIRTIDRTLLILDIFAARAHTREGILQVGLAQLKYTLPRLSGKGIELSRLGGGIGTRGPGESKLESDRRHIRRRIKALEDQLQKVEQHRKGLRDRRKKDGVTTVAIVGYTNAGKSTLMNALTGAGVLVENKLFATLDPTSRALKLPDGREVMLIDTVGLIRKLPHHLVEAFKSTLEEAAFADVILNLCDASSEEAEVHLKVTEELLSELGCKADNIISVLNKSDLQKSINPIAGVNYAVKISALLGQGLDELLEAIVKILPPTRKQLKLLFPFEKGALAALVRKDGVINSEEYTEDGLLIDAIVDLRMMDEIKDYIV